MDFLEITVSTLVEPTDFFCQALCLSIEPAADKEPNCFQKLIWKTCRTSSHGSSVTGTVFFLDGSSFPHSLPFPLGTAHPFIPLVWLFWHRRELVWITKWCNLADNLIRNGSSVWRCVTAANTDELWKWRVLLACRQVHCTVLAIGWKSLK